jgi:hypothetical protein
MPLPRPPVVAAWFFVTVNQVLVRLWARGRVSGRLPIVNGQEINLTTDDGPLTPVTGPSSGRMSDRE